MCKHAILLTWENMLSNKYRDQKVENKYRGKCSKLYFGSDVSASLETKVKEVPLDEQLKIFISGHGGPGRDYIGDESRLQIMTVNDLAALLAHALRERNNRIENSDLTHIRMTACSFGRTVDGTIDSIPAEKLHRRLSEHGTYVVLFARTESAITRPRPDPRRRFSGGIIANETRFPLDTLLNPTCSRRKTPYTKVKYSYQHGSRISNLVSYQRDVADVETDGLEGRRLLWADYAVNRIVNSFHIRTKATHEGSVYSGQRSGGREEKEVTDPREKILETLMVQYKKSRNPEKLWNNLSSLVDPQYQETFLKHRDLWSAFVPFFVPEKARMILQLLKEYPS